jgi:DNA-binding NarL/FixJ family response regulator
MGRRVTVGQERLPVRKIREVLRLKAEGFSDRQIAAAIGSARSTAVHYRVWSSQLFVDARN